MRKIVVALAGTVSGLIMLFSYHTSLGGSGSVVAVGTSGASGATGSGGASDTASDPTTSPSDVTTPTSTPKAPTASAAASTKVTGDTVQTEWGPVQIQLTVKGGNITAVDAVQYPNGNPRDQEINAVALPILADEALRAQSAQIDMVSGATITSRGYLASLQSALDRANL